MTSSMETYSALLALCWGIQRSPVNSPHKGQWRGALMFSLTCAWINGWVNNRETGGLRRHHAQYDAIVMIRFTKPGDAYLRQWIASFMACRLFGSMYTCVYDCKYRYVHDDVIKWKHFPRYWPFVRGIHQSPVNSPHKGQWRGALMFSLIWAWIDGWVNNREAGDLRRHRAHYDVNVM